MLIDREEHKLMARVMYMNEAFPSGYAGGGFKYLSTIYADDNRYTVTCQLEYNNVQHFCQFNAEDPSHLECSDLFDDIAELFIQHIVETQFQEVSKDDIKSKPEDLYFESGDKIIRLDYKKKQLRHFYPGFSQIDIIWKGDAVWIV